MQARVTDPGACEHDFLLPDGFEGAIIQKKGEVRMYIYPQACEVYTLGFS
jgi:hypothetical protein